MSLDRRRAFGPMLWVAAMASLALALHGVAYLIMDEMGDALMIFSLSHSVGFVAPVLPLVAALPFGTGYCADCQYGYAAHVVTRAGRARYLRSKGLACALSGGLAAALGMLAFMAFLVVRYPIDFAVAPPLNGQADLTSLLGQSGLPAYAAYAAIRLLCTFLAGSFWAMTALTFSAFYPNTSLTLCAPLVLYRLIAELGQWRFFPAYLDVKWLSEGGVLPSSALSALAALAVYMVLNALLFALFAWRAGRRLRYA